MLQKSSTRIGGSTPSAPKVERPPLFDLLLSLIDARVSHVDILDTAWGRELEEYLQARHAVRRAARGRGASVGHAGRNRSSRPR